MSAAFPDIHAGPVPRAPARRSDVGRNLLTLLALAVVLGFATRVIELRPLALLRDVGNVGVFLRGYLHPSSAHLGEYAWQCVVTVCIALWGTLLAVAIAVPLGLLGARNLSPHPALYFLARRVMDVLRAVNEFVFALMFVTAVGAGRLHVIAFGVAPQILPNFLSYVLLRFESDIRSASVIGMVGGGGIGFYLWDTIRSFRDREAATVILLIVVMVMCIDVVSARIRRATI